MMTHPFSPSLTTLYVTCYKVVAADHQTPPCYQSSPAVISSAHFPDFFDTFLFPLVGLKEELIHNASQRNKFS